jgi:4-hydroxy-3-polyprenylbenzoate decarboxylase
MKKLPVVLAITGASGVIYALRLLDQLLRSAGPVHLTISPSGRTVLEQELAITVDLEQFRADSLAAARPRGSAAEASRPDGAAETDMQRLVRAVQESLQDALQSGPPDGLRYYHYQDFLAPIASGSFLTAGMVVCPCSGSTLSAVVHGAGNNLIQRAADVHLKERRRLILVPRETPLSVVQLDNMQRACAAGAVVLPAMPGWYHGVASLGDLVDFVVARILDQLGVAHNLLRRWGEDADGPVQGTTAGKPSG